MSTESTPDISARLACGYDELTRVEDALRDAERRLLAAHLDGARQQSAERPEQLYREVLSLRDRSRQVLSELGDTWVADR